MTPRVASNSGAEASFSALLLRAFGAGAFVGAVEAARHGLLEAGEWLRAVVFYAGVLGGTGFVGRIALARAGRFWPPLCSARFAELIPATLGLLLALAVGHLHVSGEVSLALLLATLLGLAAALPLLARLPGRAYAVVLAVSAIAFAGFGLLRLQAEIADDRRLDTRIESSAASDINVILLLVDSLRPDHLGSSGYERDTSPTLDRMATGGRLFRRAVNPGTSANWATIHASAYPSTHYLDLARAELPNLPELFGEAGWSTFGLTAHWEATAGRGFDRGLDTFRSARRASLGRLPLIYAYVRLMGLVNRAGGIAEDAWHEPADEMIDHLLRITTAQRDENFLIWAHLMDLHIPYQPGPGYADRFQDDPNLGYHRNPSGLRDSKGGMIAARVANARARYDGALCLVDDQLARLTDHLEQLGIADKTLIVVTADHGDAFGEHGLLVHPIDRMYSEIVDVPLIFYEGRGLRPGIVDTPVSTLDILPTLAGFVGIPVPADAEGVDLSCLLRDRACAWEREWVYWDGTAFGDGRGPMGLTGRRYRYWEPLDGDPELYDLEQDPGELVNLHGSGLAIEPGLAEQVEAFRRERVRAAEQATGVPPR